MSERELRDMVEKVVKSQEQHDRILNGDPVTGYPGLIRKLEDNSKSDAEFRQEVKGTLDNISTQLGTIALWRQEIIETPGRIRKLIITMGAIASALIAIAALIGKLSG